MKATHAWLVAGLLSVAYAAPITAHAAHKGGKAATGHKVGGVPSDALGLCNDGTYVSTGAKDTACSAHGGMKIWYLDGTPNN